MHVTMALHPNISNASLLRSIHMCYDKENMGLLDSVPNVERLLTVVETLFGPVPGESHWHAVPLRATWIAGLLTVFLVGLSRG